MQRSSWVTSLEYVRANHHAGRLSSAFVPLLRMVVVTAFAGMLIYGGQLALCGELALAMYSVVVFQTQSLLWPLVGLGNWLDHYRRAMASAARVLDLLELSRARGAQPDGPEPGGPFARAPRGSGKCGCSARSRLSPRARRSPPRPNARVTAAYRAS